MFKINWTEGMQTEYFDVLRRYAKRANYRLWICAPYVGSDPEVLSSRRSYPDLKFFVDLHEDTVKRGSTNPYEVWKLREHLNAQIYSHPSLHAKVVLIDNRAVVGSANYSRNAFENQIEAAYVFSRQEEIRKVEKFFERLQDESVAVDRQRIKELKRIWDKRPPASPRDAARRSRIWFLNMQASAKEYCFENRRYHYPPGRGGKNPPASRLTPGDILIVRHTSHGGFDYGALGIWYLERARFDGEYVKLSISPLVKEFKQLFHDGPFEGNKPNKYGISKRFLRGALVPLSPGIRSSYLPKLIEKKRRELATIASYCGIRKRTSDILKAHTK